MTSPLQTLFVAWVEPDTDARQRYPVARLDRQVDARGRVQMLLRYVEGVQDAIERGFRPFPGMGALHTEYRTSDAFFFVRQRIMRPSRPDYADWIASLGWPEGFDASADPFRVLVRSGGRNTTDRLEFFAPVPLGDNRWRFEFFVRYVRGNEALATQLAEGVRPPEPLRLERDPENPFDSNTLAVRDARGGRVGYVPAYYKQALHDAASLPDSLDILALNPAPESSAYRLLVACEATLSPGWSLSRSNSRLRRLPTGEEPDAAAS